MVVVVGRGKAKFVWVRDLLLLESGFGGRPRLFFGGEGGLLSFNDGACGAAQEVVTEEDEGAAAGGSGVVVAGCWL